MTLPPTLQFTVHTPAPVSSLGFGDMDKLFVGSDDGSLRLFNLPSTRVVKAITGLGSEISSIAWVSRKDTEVGDVWMSCGTKAILFEMDNPKIILTMPDAVCSLDLGEHEGDVLNEISLSHNHKHLAFSTDGGAVGVIDLLTKQVTRMKIGHKSICGSVGFVPGRPNELLSGGYDSALLHFDIILGSILSRHDFVAPPSDGVSLSPPFIHSISFTHSGAVAASTADGRIWVGLGGMKRSLPDSQRKRSRRWKGLKPSEGSWIKAAEGPVVSVIFSDSSSLTACTLLGTIIHYNSRNNLWETVWTTTVTRLAKVNSMQVQGFLTAVGGFDTAGKGVVEILRP